MDILEQMQCVRGVYLCLMERLCKKQFLFQVAAVYHQEKQWYDKQLELLSLLSAQAEAGLMEANPHRALRYTCAVYKCIERLEEKAGRDFKKFQI